MSVVLGLEPAFDSASVNVTVIAGQTALLPCSITYLGKYKVGNVTRRSLFYHRRCAGTAKKAGHS